VLKISTFPYPQHSNSRCLIGGARHTALPHHIDYAFTGSQWVIKHVEVGSPDQWLQYSDHMPVVVDQVRAGQS
jgi:endonuclease/exonuclease/phosphatase family metal-dependent hydrolase